MEQLDFELPDFVRVAWVSDLAKEVWEPRFQKIIKVLDEAKWSAIVEGVLPYAILSMAHEDYVESTNMWLNAGLAALPIGYQDSRNYTYSRTITDPDLIQSSMINVVVGKSQDLLEFQSVYESAESLETVYELLEHPLCCRRRIVETLEGGWTDPIWSLFLCNAQTSDSKQYLEVDAITGINFLWYALRIQTIPHFPCSFNCNESIKLSKTIVDIARNRDYRQAMDWLQEILVWPIKWSALHGIAELKTPVLKVSKNTDATATTYTIKCLGSSYPVEGARGVNFPYKR